MKKIIVGITMLLIMIGIIGYMVNNSDKKVELVQTPVSTMEPYDLYSQWESEIFKPYGFGNVALPADVYHDKCEGGQNYAIGTFYTDKFERFQYFFQMIYRVIWGEIYDVTKVLDNKNGVYSFKERCVIPKSAILESQKGEPLGNIHENQYMSVYVEFDTNDNKVTFECRKVDKDGKEIKGSSKEKKTNK